MSDDVKDTKPSDEGGKTVEPKTYSEEEFKKVIAERDKAKEKVRKIEEDEKKALEAKAIEEGKLKEVLTAKEAELEAMKAKAAAYEASQAKLKEQTLAKITDEKMRSVAAKLPTVEDVMEFADNLNKTTAKTFTDKAPTHPSEPTQYKNAREWEKALREKGLA